MNDIISRYPQLKMCKNDVDRALKALIDCYENGGKLLLCGNGGSAADCDHIVGELMKGFLLKRPLSEEKRAKMKNKLPSLDEDALNKLQMGLPAISLSSISALNTAFCNDVDADLVYAQSLLALASERDCLFAISTSGNSKNVIHAVKVAKALGLRVIGLSGIGGGLLSELCDICIRVPECETYKVQELHLPIYHYLCAKVEDHFFG